MSLLSRDTRVTVLRGGPSDEYDISMQTGAGVLSALTDLPYDVEDIIVTRSGEWLKNGVVKSPEKALAATDVVFLAFHGSYGEDGTVQRLLDRLSIPYTGSGAHASATAMNKLITKEYLKPLGIKMAPHMRVTADSKTNLARIANTISSLFSPDYVIKPINGGSSVGTHIATSLSELMFILEEVLEKHPDVLVEQRIVGREATSGVVERFRNQSFYRLPCIEIVPPQKSGFFAADVKYTGETEEICPGRFKREEKHELETLAVKVHAALNLSQYSRSDFIVAKDGIYFLEVNPFPYLGQHSPFLKGLESVGVSTTHFVDHLLKDTR